MTTTDLDRSRRHLRWTVATLVALPTVTGLRQVLQGGAGIPGVEGATSPNVDSELRYANTFKAFTGPIVWSNLDDVETAPAVTIALGAALLGGGSRLLAWRHSGRPHPVSLAALGIELVGVPGLLVWRRRIAKLSARKGF